jgi:hypothetical protein
MWKLVSYIGEEHRQSVFENTVLKRGSKRGEVTGDWKEMRDEELNNLYFTPNVIMMI